MVLTVEIVVAFVALSSVIVPGRGQLQYSVDTVHTLLHTGLLLMIYCQAANWCGRTLTFVCVTWQSFSCPFVLPVKYANLLVLSCSLSLFLCFFPFLSRLLLLLLLS